MSTANSWKEEISIIVLGCLGAIMLIKGQDAGLLAAIITAVAGIAGYRLGRKAS